jgi:hypothetical protein
MLARASTITTEEIQRRELWKNLGEDAIGGS